jgi:uncharacterized protein (DUF433 family)
MRKATTSGAGAFSSRRGEPTAWWNGTRSSALGPGSVTFGTVIAGIQITIELVLEKLAASESVEQILLAHPRLTAEGIRAAIGFAAEVLRADVVYPVEQLAG